MKHLAIFARLTAMRRRGGASMSTSLRWAAALAWRSRLATHHRRAQSRSAGYERV
ncbi:hypothetical protein [Ottowia thiooxydans]|uniref:hypothetical protein n=1 Tax=Ottowia thiooxydans TaxID=219182 RepID=UPI00042A3931|nr:hypothetical protein [Ottowia thiooxydans]